MTWHDCPSRWRATSFSRAPALQAGSQPACAAGLDPAIKLAKSEAGLNLELKTDSAWVAEQTRTLVTTERLGKASVPNLPWSSPMAHPYA